MNNEEKILSLLDTIVSTVNELKQGQTNVEQKLFSLEHELQSVKDIALRMENSHGQKLTALFDGYSLNYDQSKNIDIRITKLEHDVEKLTFELKYLKSSN